MGRPTDEQIETWYPRLFRTALRMTGCIEEAADVTQETFCKALGGWGHFDGRASRTTWLHQILLNCIRDRIRKRDVAGTVSLIDEWELVAAKNGRVSASKQTDQGVDMDMLRHAIADLPQRLRTAFIATVIDGYTYRQAAELLSVPVGTIASRVNQARTHLRGKMFRNASRRSHENDG